MILARLRRPDVIVGLLLVLALIVVAIGAPWLAPHSPTRMAPAIKYLPPSWIEGGKPEYLLGTDQLGRDVLSRLMYGAQTSLIIAVTATLLGAILGSVLGLVSGYFGGWIDTIVMRLADIQLAFPFILLALAILSVTESKAALTIIIVLAVADWVIHARVFRSRVLVEREKEYVRSARALGASDTRIMFLYVLPSVLPTAIVIALIELAVLMLVESILSFIGLGIDPPAVSWGTALADGRRSMANAWWMLVFPGMAIFMAVLAINLVADGLADVLDPRLKLSGIVRKALRPRQARRFISATPTTSTDTAPLLDVRNLAVEFPQEGGPTTTAVEDVSFTVKAGERVGIVGESGSGKSVTALTIMGLLDPPGRVAAGEVRYKGRDLLAMSERELNSLRGNGLAMVFQDASTALNPTFRIGWQIEEAIMLHRPVSRPEARRIALDMLRMVNIAEPERVARSYPFEVSGGMQQRAMIAIALSCRPDLLIADEPTTALDVTTQAQILRELDSLIAEIGSGIVLISHDLGVVAEFTDRVLVMYQGKVVESGPTAEIVSNPRHPYTQRLLAAVRAVEGGEAATPELLHVAG